MFRFVPGPSLGRLAGVALLALVAQATLVYWLISWQIGAWWVANAAALWITMPAALLFTGRHAEPALLDSARPLRLLAGLVLAAALTLLTTAPNLVIALVLDRLTESFALAVTLAFALCVPPAMWIAAKLLASLPWPAHLMAAPPLPPAVRRRRLSAAVAARPVLAAFAALAMLGALAFAMVWIVRAVDDVQPPPATLGAASRPATPTPTQLTPQPAPSSPNPASPMLNAPGVPEPNQPDITDTNPPASEPQTQAGIASWYYGPSGTCAAKGFARGTVIKVVYGQRALTCRVTMTGPRVAGRIVNLPQSSFAKLAHPKRGLVHVTVSAVA